MVCVGSHLWLTTREGLQIRNVQSGEIEKSYSGEAYRPCVVGDTVWVAEATSMRIYSLQVRV